MFGDTGKVLKNKTRYKTGLFNLLLVFFTIS